MSEDTSGDPREIAVQDPQTVPIVTRGDSLVNGAIDLAAQGFRVLALHGPGDQVACGCAFGHPPQGDRSRGKKPIESNWQNLATRDPAVIIASWRATPGANIGIAMGGDQRFVALDVDSDEGRASLALLEAQ